MVKYGCIYRLTNTVTGRKYIGKTVQFKNRMSCHSRSWKPYYKKPQYLARSIGKHGWDAFKQEIIIDNVPEEDLNDLEKTYIEMEHTMAPNGYNLTVGGEGASGYRHTDEMIQKMKQRRHTEETKQKMRKYKHTEETKQKMRQARKQNLLNKKKIGCIFFRKNSKKWLAISPRFGHPGKQITIGRYFTEEKARKALKHYLATKERIPSDTKIRQRGTGNIRRIKSGRYQANILYKSKFYNKVLDTVEQAEAWLREIKLKNIN